MNKWCCAKCALTVCVTWGVQRVCAEDKWCGGAATGWLCSLKTSPTASVCGWRCHWVLTEAPLCSHLSALSDGNKSRQALDGCTFNLAWAPPLHLLSSCHHPPSAEELSQVQRAAFGALVPRSSRLCLLALSSGMASAEQPPPSLSKAAPRWSH